MVARLEDRESLRPVHIETGSARLASTMGMHVLAQPAHPSALLALNLRARPLNRAWGRYSRSAPAACASTAACRAPCVIVTTHHHPTTLTMAINARANLLVDSWRRSSFSVMYSKARYPLTSVVTIVFCNILSCRDLQSCNIQACKF